jgi:SNF2 family DNA or RNA helicase
MILTWNHPNYILRAPRGEGEVLRERYGLDLSLTATTLQEAVLFTREPYAALTFVEHADESARARLAPLLEMVEKSRALIGIGHYRVPRDQELWPFQVADLDYIFHRFNRGATGVLVGDEPGLGKTMTAIAAANELRAQKVLVICPAAIRFQWMRRIQDWSTMPPTAGLQIILNGNGGVNPASGWTVVSYELARHPPIQRALVAAGPYDLLIVDEAHFTKTVAALRTRAIWGYLYKGVEDSAAVSLASVARHHLALTGTPLPNRPREAYMLSRALCFDAIDFLSERKFAERFNPSQIVKGVSRKTGKPYTYVDERTGRTAELQNRLRVNFMTRHLKRDVLPQLKMPVFDLIEVEETRVVKQVLQAEKLLDIDPEAIESGEIPVDGAWASARRQMGEAIAPQVAEYVKMLLRGGEEKLVVFAWHISVLDYLEHEFHSLGVVRVDGSTSAKAKDARVAKFIRDPRVHIIIGNLLSLGTGVDGLQEVAWHALIAEPDPVPGVNIQAFDRLDRGGQTRTVQGDIFVAPGSILEKCLTKALRKLYTTHQALDYQYDGGK